jgi:hypothetical protein
VGGSAESQLTLDVGTPYTVTVGGGGTGYQTYQQQQQLVEILFFQRSHPLAEVLVAVMPWARLMVLTGGSGGGAGMPLLLREPLGQGL